MAATAGSGLSNEAWMNFILWMGSKEKEKKRKIEYFIVIGSYISYLWSSSERLVWKMCEYGKEGGGGDENKIHDSWREKKQRRKEYSGLGYWRWENIKRIKQKKKGKNIKTEHTLRRMLSEHLVILLLLLALVSSKLDLKIFRQKCLSYPILIYLYKYPSK